MPPAAGMAWGARGEPCPAPGSARGSLPPARGAPGSRRCSAPPPVPGRGVAVGAAPLAIAQPCATTRPTLSSPPGPNGLPPPRFAVRRDSRTPCSPRPRRGRCPAHPDTHRAATAAPWNVPRSHRRGCHRPQNHRGGCGSYPNLGITASNSAEPRPHAPHGGVGCSLFFFFPFILILLFLFFFFPPHPAAGSVLPAGPGLLRVGLFFAGMID